MSSLLPKTNRRKLLLLILSGVIAAWVATPAFAQVSGSLLLGAGKLIAESGIINKNRTQAYHCITSAN